MRKKEMEQGYYNYNYGYGYRPYY